MTQHFEGVIGRDWRESTPWWPPEPAIPPDAPNVLLIVLDDVGYAQLGCYGSDISTPVIDRLATEGVRLANFHTTALCSPTRSCLLTGRNHHRNGMARVADLAVGYPGYWGMIPRENGFLPEILRTNGYATYAVGKWHLTPEDEVNMAGSRASWPLGRGFDRWYGFHGGETHQFAPSLYHDNHAVLAPGTYEDGYHLSADLADRAIEFVSDLRAVDDEQPFFCYLATGACHSPHHAHPEWIARYHGQFDIGWDAWREATFARQVESGLLPAGTELTPRPHWVPAWDDLAPEDQAVAARFMECFAAYLSFTDAQIGRVVDYLEESGDLDNTLIILCSDNGASSEGGARGSINDARPYNGASTGRRELRERIDELGGPTTHNNYPWGWTMAGNTPFKRWKREVHEGGVADPCIVRLPSARRDPEAGGTVRHQFAHAIDILPTVLELIGVDAPETIDSVAQSPIDGTSFLHAVNDADAPARHTTQYFEMLGSRAIYHDGWKAVTFHALGNIYDDGLDADAPFDDDVWELYHVAEDLSESHDLAAQEPDRLARMIDLWWEEARRNDVLPLDNRPLNAILNPRPRRRGARHRYVYKPFGAPVPEPSAVHVPNREHTITAEVEIGDDTAAAGILLAMGSALGGFALYLREGRLRYVHNLYGKERHVVASDEVIASGAHELAFSFKKTKGFAGTGTLRVDGRVVGEGEIPHFTPMAFTATGGGLTCGYEVGPAVGDDYVAPFRCNANIRQVIVEVSGEHERDPMAVFQAIMAEQ
jgi:arylsulfatase A-like enzyme